MGVYACDKESTVLCYECCDCVNLRNVMELFGKKLLGSGGVGTMRE